MKADPKNISSINCCHHGYFKIHDTTISGHFKPNSSPCLAPLMIASMPPRTFYPRMPIYVILIGPDMLGGLFLDILSDS